MKKTKLFVLVAMLVMASLTLSGCFFGTSESDSDFAENDHYQLDLKVRGEGRVKDLSEGKHEFEEGVVVDLEAIPDDGWKFKEWIGSVSESNEKKTSIFMDKNRQLVAVFEEESDDENDQDPDDYNLDLSMNKISSEELTYEITGNSDPEAYFFDFYVDGDFVGGNGSSEQTSSSQSIEHTFDSSKEGEEVKVRLDILNLDNEVLESKTRTFTLDTIDDENDQDPDDYNLDLSMNKISSEELTYEITGNSDPEAYFFDFYVDGDFVGGNGSSEQTSSSQSIEHTFDSSKEGEEVKVRLDILNLDNEVLESKTRTFTLDTIDDDPDPAHFNVSINNTNSPITEGDELQVDITVENTGQESDTQDIDLLIDGTVEDSERVSLSESDSTTITLNWSTTTGEDGEYTIEVSSDDDSASETVMVDEESSTSDEVSFSYERLESLRYEFTSTEPDNAVYYEWKFPNDSYWQGYDGQNTITHTFDSSGDKRVQLRILNEEEEIIGEDEETIDVD
ncbi:MAG: InlB B-repeat-containing protein [Patescibacteria group bacterium]